VFLSSREQNYKQSIRRDKMSLAKFTEFVKQITTESTDPAKNSDLKSAFSGLTNVEGEARLEATAKKLAEVAKSKGFDVSETDVKEYFNSLKSQYDLNPMMASMMDSYCSSTCHLGSAVGKN
jgi:Ca2+-binding EF-hand superfamily protein